MQCKVLLLTAALGVVLNHPSYGQGPVGDEVMVTFDQTVQVGSSSLPAGKYTVRQVTSASNPRVLEFTSDNGTKLDATVTAVPILQNIPPSKTRVILDNEGSMPRVDKIWVQGKSYGYAFPGKSNAATAANGISLQGTFVAQAAPAPAPPVAQATPPQPAPEPAPQAAPPPVIAQNQPPETPAPAPAPEPAPAPQPDQGATHEVPSTALGWMQLALLGTTLASAGGFLYRRERANR